MCVLHIPLSPVATLAVARMRSLLLILFVSACSPVTNGGTSCKPCYIVTRHGDHLIQTFTYYSHVESVCYNSFTICTEDGRQYKMARMVGRQNCPIARNQFVCTPIQSSGSNCCLNIGDTGKSIMDIASRIQNLAHVPVQTWNSGWEADWWSNLLGGAWWKRILVTCCLPCLIWLI